MDADAAVDQPAPAATGVGDNSAAGAFACVAAAWQAHEGELRGCLRHRLTDAQAADDVLQDVFVKAMRQGKDFCSLANPRAWLFQVARNALVDRLRVAHRYELRARLRLRDRLTNVCRVQFEADGSICGHGGRAAP